MTGYPIVADEQIMLVFGGFTIRKKWNDTYNTSLLFDECDNLDFTKINASNPHIKNCGMELANDLWRYHIELDKWT
jgi:hypothetical protein